MSAPVWKIVIALVLSIGAAWLHEARSADDIRIGYTPFLTGIRAGLGANELKAIQLAVKQINGSGGINGKPVTLVVARKVYAGEQFSLFANPAHGDASVADPAR